VPRIKEDIWKYMSNRRQDKPANCLFSAWFACSRKNAVRWSQRQRKCQKRTAKREFEC